VPPVAAVQAKVQILLSPAGESWPDAVRDELMVVAGRVPDEVDVRLLMRVPDDPSPHLAARVEGLGMASPSYDAVVELESATVSLSTLVGAVEGAASRLAAAIDPVRSAAIAGSELVVVAGEAPFEFVYPIRHRADLTPDAFHAYWLHEHLDVSRQHGNVGRLRFRQFHGHLPSTRAAAASAGVRIDDLDGAAVGFYDEPEQFRRVAVDPSFTMDDEANFIDQTRSSMGLYRVHRPGEAPVEG
jgi:hypothetical protein